MQSSVSFSMVMRMCLFVLMGENKDLGELLSHSELQFPNMKMEMIKIIVFNVQGCCKN